MSSLSFLVTELQSLASESRRKHPEIREAAEKSLTILKSSPEQAIASLASDGAQSDDLLRPVFMGCATKNAKVVAISVGSLQRLISLKAVPQSAVPLIIGTMSDCMSQGVDIQLRILQTLVSLIMNFPAVHGELLGEALLLCFKLQDSRIAVVSSSAAATLRQLVMFVFDKIADEDGQDSVSPEALSEVTLPDGRSASLGPSAKDAYSVFEDLCLLVNSEKPHFLNLDHLHKTFALELIESVLTNYHDIFRQRSALLLLLQHHLCPLLLKSLSDRAVFPLTLRCFRVVFLLLKKFSSQLKTEAEVFFTLLIKIVSGDSDTGAFDHSGVRPPWVRVLAMEIMRGLCSDAELIRNIWDRYDAQQTGANVFTSLITALKRLVTEKPAVLGVCPEMSGLALPSHSTEGGGSSGSAYGLDVGGVAGMVATAASATVSGVVGMMGSGFGLNVQTSGMKLQCIDQLDKADSPPIPETYIYLLSVQCIVSLCDGFASFTGPMYTSIMVQRPRTGGDSPVRAPAALDLSTLPPEEPATTHLGIVSSMVEHGWPALLAALSFIISTNLSDELFIDVLTSYQAMANVAGMFALSTPRDAFLTGLSKLAVPSRVVASVESYAEPSTPRSSTSLTDNLGLTTPPVPPSLSERNLVCLKVLISSALFLAGSLGESWYGILETLQNADYVLNMKGTQLPPSRRNSAIPGGISTSRIPSGTGVADPARTAAQSVSRNPLLADTDSESIQLAVQRLFEASKNLEDAAFQDFVKALCKLSSEMVGMHAEMIDFPLHEIGVPEELPNPTGLSPRIARAHRRRISGIFLPRALRSGDFGVERLGVVAMLNIHRLIHRPPEIAWDPTTSHLLSIIGLPSASPPIRMQAARVLDEILVVVPRNLSSSSGELQSKVQRRVLDALEKQIVPSAADNFLNMVTSTELRRMGLETLHQILQASGHTLVVGWESIFEMLGSVCKPAVPSHAASVDSVSIPSPQDINRPESLPVGYNNERGYTALVKIAFQSLKLVCDAVSVLSPEHLRLCIMTLGQFGRQADTNIALTAAESLLWAVSDSIQAKRKDAQQEPEYSELWMFLLLEVLGLCTDARPEVRVGAIQTLFRAMQLYGATLSSETWDECMWKITFPLLDAISVETRRVLPEPLASASPERAWDESKSLALQWIGSITNEFLVSKIMGLSSFKEAWKVFVSHIQDTVLLDRRPLSTPALQCLDKAADALSNASVELQPQVAEAWECVWNACSDIGTAVLQGSRSPLSPRPDGATNSRPFTQDSLVAFVRVVGTVRRVSRQCTSSEWELGRLTRLMEVLKGVLTYPDSPDYRPDIDGLTPVQASVMEDIEGIDPAVPGSPSLVMRDLAGYITLPFLASFPAPESPMTPVPGSTQQQVTYIGLSKKAMPSLMEMYLRFKDAKEIYEDGTLEAVLSAFSIPMKLKYECPAPSKFGSDQPLWKTATMGFLRIVTASVAVISRLEEDISDARVESIWRQIIEGFRGGMLADCSAAEMFTLEEQEREETFDLALVHRLEADIVPHLGNARVPDYLVSQLSRILQQGSQLVRSPVAYGCDDDDDDDDVPLGLRRVGTLSLESGGSTEPHRAVFRERFAFGCFDLLFILCARTETTHGEVARRRAAALCLSALLGRCKTAMVGYIADAALRGNLPFPRVQEDELLYVLQKLRDLRLWPGTLWAACSDSPTQYSAEQPAVDATLPATALIADVMRRSPVAHLFHFYPVLCELAAGTQAVPSARVQTGGDKGGMVMNGDGVRTASVDARGLAKACLRLLGQEMGAM